MGGFRLKGRRVCVIMLVAAAFVFLCAPRLASRADFAPGLSDNTPGTDAVPVETNGASGAYRKAAAPCESEGDSAGAYVREALEDTAEADPDADSGMPETPAEDGAPADSGAWSPSPRTATNRICGSVTSSGRFFGR